MLIFLLAISAMILAAVCCMYSKFPMMVRSFCVFYLIIATLIIVGATASYRGAPIYKRVVPDDIIIYGQYINKKTGYINILFSYDKDQEPSYAKVDYDLELHKALSDGAKMAQGEPFKIKKEGKGEGSGDGEGEGEGKGKNGQDGDSEGGEDADGEGSLSQRSFTYKAYKLPPPLLPQKNY